MSSEQDSILNSNISNDEIRRRLVHEYRLDCGPVTASTRRVFLLKLAKLEKERNHVTGVANDNNHDQSFSSDNSINQVDESFIINGKHVDTSEHVENDKISRLLDEPNRATKKNSPRRYSPRRKTAEEIEAIKSFNEINQQMKKKQFINQESSESKLTKNLRNSIVKTVNLTDLSPKLSQYSSESSESDDDNSIENTPQISFLNSRISTPRIFNGESYKSPLTRPPIRRTIVDNKSASLLNYSDSESDIDEGRNDKLCKMLLSHRPGLGRVKPRAKSSYYQKIALFFSNLKKKLTPTQTDYSSINFSASSNYISFALLIFVVFFFVIIFSVYFYAKFTFNAKHTLDLNDYTFIEDKSKLVAPVCDLEKLETQPLCLPFESDRKPALNIVKEIKGYIDKSIYDYYCKENNPTRDITSFEYPKGQIVKEMEGKVDLFLQERDSSLANYSAINLFSRDFDNAIKLLKLNPSWNLDSHEIDFEDAIVPSSDYTVHLPLRCNLSVFWQVNMWYIIITALSIGIPSLAYAYFRKTKRAASEEQNMVYDLIEKSIELLQSPDEPQSMPVLHIRDTLLSPSERKSSKYRRVWNKVVNYIEKSESRVKVEFKKIDGEDFKAWKWIAANAGANYLLNDNEIDFDASMAAVPPTQKIGGVEWQGQAFGNLLANKNSQPQPDQSEQIDSLNISAPISPEVYRNKNFQALTRFLKIRNIFEKEAQFLDPNWTKKIKNTILEKTANASTTGVHDIVHIELEDNPSEGLVYMKCASIAGATNAFHALHGWWCEKKLVSVKFLKEDRYYQRFPQAKSANTPLNTELVD